MPAPIHEDDLKRRARRRLIGAVALTLIAVIVLPLMLEDEPPPAAHLQVLMPANSKTPDFVPILPTPVTPAAPAPETAPPAPPVAKPDTTTESKSMDSTSAPQKTEVPPPAAKNPAPSSATPTRAEAQKPTEPETKPVPVKKPPKANPPAQTQSNSAEDPAADDRAGFVVQLGAFSDPAKTADLKQRADNLGMASYTEKSGSLTRLRVGPFPTREAAMAAAAKLSAAGVPGQVMSK